MAQNQPTQQQNPQSTPARRESLTQQSDSPFAVMRRLSDEMDRLFGDVFSDFGMSGRRMPQMGRSAGQAQWAPPLEVFSRGDQLVVRAELPGLKKEDINVDIDDDMLTIAGERREEREETQEGGWRHSERRYGRFLRSISLPSGINADQAKCTFKDGVLEVTLPSPQRERGRRIAIEEQRVMESKQPSETGAGGQSRLGTEARPGTETRSSAGTGSSGTGPSGERTGS